MANCKSTVVVMIALLVVPTSLTSAAPFDELLNKVPAGANTLVLIDVSTTLAAPVAQENGWGKQLELAYVDRPIFLPPEATRLVMASSLRSNEDFSRLWELAVMELSEPMSMRSIARSEGGYVDQINGVVSAWTPSNAYFVSLGEKMLGVMFPAERQFVSRWVNFTQNNSSNLLSDYLRNATQLVNSKVPMLLAIDLQDVIRPHELDENLQDLPAVKDKRLSLSEVSTVLASLQGAVLRVAIDKDVQGQLRVDFAQPVAPIKAIAKEVVLKALGELGAPVDELAEWKLEIEETAITMRGPLSKDAQRRVFSIVEIPSTKFSTLKDAADPNIAEKPSESKIREASLTYFRAVQVLFKDLRRDLQGNKAVAAVMERYARKIDRMPILNVDDELLNYGSEVATLLRSVALSKRQGGIQAGVGTAGMGYSDYSFGYYGNTVGVQTNSVRSAKDRTAIKAQALAASKNARVEGKKMIEDSSAAIRRQMTQKYGVEF